MTAKNTILVAEDHALLRDGIRALLSDQTDLKIVAEAADGRDAIQLACSLHPRLVLIDLSLPGLNGLDVIAEIKRQAPETICLVVTVHKTDEYVLRAFQLGAAGYFVKESGYAEMLAAIRTVLAGRVYLSRDISERVVSRYYSGSMKPTSSWDNLTMREREVLKLVAEGNSNKEVAACLCLSVKTIEKHRASLMHKLSLRNASTLTAYAIEYGIVTQQPLIRSRQQR